jgi:hypothetical protein
VDKLLYWNRRAQNYLKHTPKWRKGLNFKDAGWFEFLTTFQGHDELISTIFALNFDGFEVVIGKLLMIVTEHSIARACKFPVGGERWSKKENVVMEFVN